MRVEAKNFHPMRGHVEDGCVVVFSDGRELSIKNRGRGWALVNAAGEVVGRQVDGATDLTSLIVQMDGA